MTDREERQHVIEVLQNMVDRMEAANYIVAKPERRHALEYAIASIRTDLKYDLLYEETSEQADKPTTKNDVPDINVGKIDRPSVTPQFSSELEKNSKKLENPTTKDNLGVDAVSREAVHELVSSQRLDTFSDEGREWANIKIDVILRGLKELPSVTPQEPKTGHWIPIDEEPHEDYECDNCGYICSSFPTNIDPNEEYKYCPNCGARMIEPQESEDKE